MKLTKLFTHTYDEGGYITENYNKLFSQITEDKLIGYINYLYDNRMFSELSNLDEALRMFSPKLALNLLGGLSKNKNKNIRNVSILNPKGIFDYVKDKRQRNAAANKLKDMRKKRDEINAERNKKINEVNTGLYKKDKDGKFQEIIYEGINDNMKDTEEDRKARYGNNLLDDEARRYLTRFNNSRDSLIAGGDDWKSEGKKAVRSTSKKDIKTLRRVNAEQDNETRNKIAQDIVGNGIKAIEGGSLGAAGDFSVESPSKDESKVVKLPEPKTSGTNYKDEFSKPIEAKNPIGFQPQATLEPKLGPAVKPKKSWGQRLRDLFIVSPEKMMERRRNELIKNQKSGFGIPADKLEGMPLQYDKESNMYLDDLGNTYNVVHSMDGTAQLSPNNKSLGGFDPKFITVNDKGIVTNSFSNKRK